MRSKVSVLCVVTNTVSGAKDVVECELERIGDMIHLMGAGAANGAFAVTDETLLREITEKGWIAVRCGSKNDGIWVPPYQIRLALAALSVPCASNAYCCPACGFDGNPVMEVRNASASVRLNVNRHGEVVDHFMDDVSFGESSKAVCLSCSFEAEARHFRRRT